jgi:hypothetical protein
MLIADQVSLNHGQVEIASSGRKCHGVLVYLQVGLHHQEAGVGSLAHVFCAIPLMPSLILPSGYGDGVGAVVIIRPWLI